MNFYDNQVSGAAPPPTSTAGPSPPGGQQQQNGLISSPQVPTSQPPPPPYLNGHHQHLNHQLSGPPPPVHQWNLPPHSSSMANGTGGYHHHPMMHQQQQPPPHMMMPPYMTGDAAVAIPDWAHQPVAQMSTERLLFSQANSGINFDNYENIPVEMSGEDAPTPIDRFTDADLHQWIQENIVRAGYTKPTPVQKNSIPALCQGRDLMSCAQTGSGKTAAFLLPIINSILLGGPQAIMPPSMNSQGRRCFYPAALVLSPTRELAMQIHKEADKFSYRTNIITSILYGGRENYRDQINRLRAGCHILIATPGRLIDIIDQGYVGLNGIKYLVLDEADRMLDMGFEPQIRKVVSLAMPDKTQRVTAMFSATFPKEIQVLAQDFLKENYVFLAVGRVGSTSENIEQHVDWIEEHDKKRMLCSILDSSDPSSLILCFVETKRSANDLAWFLQRQNVRAVSIHGDLKQMERERNLELFRTGKCNVLVATAVAARGLDIPNVRHVVNFDLPNDVDEYVHRIGRTGRCGNTGIATSFFNDKNRGLARDLLNLLTEANQEVPEFIRRCAAEGGSGRGRNGRFGGTDARRGRGGGAQMNGGYGGMGGGARGGSGYCAAGMVNGFGGGARNGYQQNGFSNAMAQPQSMRPFSNGGGFGGGFPNGAQTYGGAGGFNGMAQQAPQQRNYGGGGGFGGSRGFGASAMNQGMGVPQQQQQYGGFGGGFANGAGSGGFGRSAPQQPQQQQHFGMWGQ